MQISGFYPTPTKNRKGTTEYVFRERRLFSELLLLAALILGGAFLTILLSASFMSYFPEQMQHPWMMRLLQALSTILFFGAPVFFWRVIHVEPFAKDFVRPIGWGRLCFLSFAIVMLLQPVVWFFTYMNGWLSTPDWLLGLEQRATSLLHTLLSNEEPAVLLANLMVVAVIPAICEELFFRGLLLSFFIRRGMKVHVAVWVVAIIFSTVHLQLSGFLVRILYGAVLGYLFHYTGTLWMPIVVHAINNGMVVFIYYFFQKLAHTPPPDSFEFSFLLVFLAIICGWMIVLLIKGVAEKKKEAEIPAVTEIAQIGEERENNQF